jgi:predicted dithiol-disulfide oxidoreductase (DUF899 family)
MDWDFKWFSPYDADFNFEIRLWISDVEIFSWQQGMNE